MDKKWRPLAPVVGLSLVWEPAPTQRDTECIPRRLEIKKCTDKGPCAGMPIGNGMPPKGDEMRYKLRNVMSRHGARESFEGNTPPTGSVNA